MFKHVPENAVCISHLKRRLPSLSICLAILAGMGYLYWQEFNPKSLSLTPSLGNPELLTSQHRFAFEKRPYKAVRGEHFNLFRPWYDMRPQLMDVQQLLAFPEDWVARLTSRLHWLDPLTAGYGNRTQLERAKAAYLEVVKMHTSGLVYGSEERSVMPSYSTVSLSPLDAAKRATGVDWTYLGVTMTGGARLDNVKSLLEDAFLHSISGDYIETGVWRGGSSIFARAVMRSYDEGHRMSYVCDSFQGLPPGDKHLDASDGGWVGMPYLEVSAETVAENFRELGLLDPNVVFAKGFFNETMPPLSSQIQNLVVMRLDGDMYESTVDVLYNLYGKLSVGGYVIIDDWFGFPAKTACEDFFRVHKFNPEIVPIDKTAVYWQKTEEIEVQYWRYEKSNFK